jgi:hypothetical protein
MAAVSKRTRATVYRFLAMVGAGILLHTGLSGQEEIEQPAESSPRHHLGVDASFNTRDVFVGIVFHYADPFGEGFSLIGTVNVRPFGKETLVEESPGVYQYLRGERFSILLGLERQLFLTPQFSGFLNLLGGVTFPNYRGTKQGGAEAIFPVATIGIQWSVPSGKYFAGDTFAVRVGQQYLNLSEDRFRGYVSILVGL